jgi:hypothetical protein
MKKLGLFLIICGFFGIAGIAFAYTRTPSGYGVIENPVSFEVLASDIPDYFDYPSVSLWLGGGSVAGNCIKPVDNPTGFSQIFNLPNAVYAGVYVRYHGDDNCLYYGGRENLILEPEESGYYIIMPVYGCNGLAYPNGLCIETAEGWYTDPTCGNTCNIQPKYRCANEGDIDPEDPETPKIGDCIGDDENGTYYESACNNQCGVSSLYSLPMASTSDITANVGTLFSDLWVIIATACGIPLGFFVIRRVIGLF